FFQFLPFGVRVFKANFCGLKRREKINKCLHFFLSFGCANVVCLHVKLIKPWVFHVISADDKGFGSILRRKCSGNGSQKQPTTKCSHLFSVLSALTPIFSNWLHRKLMGK